MEQGEKVNNNITNYSDNNINNNDNNIINNIIDLWVISSPEKSLETGF